MLLACTKLPETPGSDADSQVSESSPLDSKPVDSCLERTFCVDIDHDGFGDPERSTESCEAPNNYVEDCTDCDDVDDGVYPGATETCDDVDENCNGSIDEGVASSTWYEDSDGDGVGVEDSTVEDCAEPSGYAATSGDCDDTDASVYPGNTEDCDGADQDCDGVVDDGAPCPCNMEFYEDETYLFCTTGSNWYTAQTFCELYGYELASADDADEDSWLYTTALTYASSYWWVGGNDQTTEGTWEWNDGTAWGYTNWCSGEPNNSHGLECVSTSREEDCAVIGWAAGGCWNDYPCLCSASEGEPYRSICEASAG